LPHLMAMRFVFWALAVCIGGTLSAQLSGKVMEAESRVALPGANVAVLNPDSSLVTGVAADSEGRFMINQTVSSPLLLQVSYLGYQTHFQRLDPGTTHVGPVFLIPTSQTLKGGEIQERATRMEISGDTATFNADAYKTNPDATVEDLLKKMPGFTQEGGQLKVQGEEIQRVMVDGQEFFGQDANLALQNLNADMVSQIQVYDRASDQAKFSGFDDGNTEKTINIITKPGMANAVFGRIYGGYGYGDDHRVRSGGNVQVFNGHRRISLIGMANNVNMQNFSNQDLTNFTGQSAAMGGGRRRAMQSGGTGPDDFMVGPQGGINKTAAFGLNFQDVWGKVKFTGAWFSNFIENEQISQINRQNFLPGGSSRFYDEDFQSESQGHNHRINFRIIWEADSNNLITFSPRFSFQERNQEQFRAGETRSDLGPVLGLTDNIFNSENRGMAFQHNLMWARKLGKPRRSFSVNLNQRFNGGVDDQNLLATNLFLNDSLNNEWLNQQGRGEREDWNHDLNIQYTEPIGKYGGIELSLNPIVGHESNRTNTWQFDSLTATYTRLDTSLTNSLNSIRSQQTLGLAYRYQKIGFTLMLGGYAEYSSLFVNREFPGSTNLEKNFFNIMPRAMLSYRFKNKANLRIFYRARTVLPGVNRLQDLLDNRNPLLLSVGNPELTQEYGHRFFARYLLANRKTGRNISLYARGRFSYNYVARSTVMASSDTVLPNGIRLSEGAQLNSFVNMDGFRNLNVGGTYGMPLSFIKSNLNITLGLNWQDAPGLINGEANQNRTLSPTFGFALGSNISEKVDFTLSYSGGYNWVFNKLQPNLNNNFYSHLASFSSQLMPWKGMVVGANLSHTRFAGLRAGDNPDFLLFNAFIGYKLLKNRSLDLRITGFDLLAQNNSIGREVSETFVEDNETNALTRYVMFSITWNFRKPFKTASAEN
jgi:hypothetical protein